ncbi:hypothetical protein LJC16_01840 [Bacteroidales bacterium OttesenSCG-928-C19]|nr:hypothetical protein [Bacteroidales bacterium OttesenSCG-928-C19]
MKTTKILLATLAFGLFFASCCDKNKSLTNTKWVDEENHAIVKFTSDSVCEFIHIRQFPDTMYIDTYDDNDKYLGQQIVIQEAGSVPEEISISYTYEYKTPAVVLTQKDDECGLHSTLTGNINGNIMTIPDNDITFTLTKEESK